MINLGAMVGFTCTHIERRVGTRGTGELKRGSGDGVRGLAEICNRSSGANCVAASCEELTGTTTYFRSSSLPRHVQSMTAAKENERTQIIR